MGLYRMAPPKLEELRNQPEELLESWHVNPSKAPFGDRGNVERGQSCQPNVFITPSVVDKEVEAIINHQVVQGDLFSDGGYDHENFQGIPTPQSCGSGSSPHTSSSSPSPIIHDNINPLVGSNKEKILNLNLEPDPAERKQILEYPLNLRNQVRRYYIQQGHCQPQYSVKVDTPFCLCCYLFKNEHGGHEKVGNSFTKSGFRSWNKATERLKAHIEESEKFKCDYRVRLNASIDVARFLLKQGMSFRGHDESETSTKRGNFVELLQWYTNKDDEVKKVVLQSAPQNNMMIAPNIQKEIVNACAKEIIKAIVEDLNGDYFRILVDESKDVSHKEQMALVMRSFKRRDMLREDQAKKLEELQVLGEVHTGSGLNQELGLQMPAITNDLNMDFQRKDQCIVKAMKLVGFAKRQLQVMRESKWESLIDDATSFCAKHDIVISEMDKNYHLGKSKRRSSSVTYSHHLRVDVFNTVMICNFRSLIVVLMR
ncbi:uncharacterized protein [Nicotiana tomentosiformis]|uniref:uncharacterized protein n=1 Tax=Nicotiana tomentosiformis TaxID=4098 RepID=UPI00388C41A7